MDTAKLQPFDMALVAAYLVSVTGLGLWLTRGVKTSRDYFLAGKSLPWWAVGMSLVVSDIGAKDMVGLAADGYRYGLVMMNFDFIGCAFPVLAAAFLFMPFLWIAGVYTVPEYLGRRYNSTVRTFFALIWACFMMGTVGTILVSAAVMFEALLGWNFWWSVGVTAVVVGVFTTVGGLKAVVLTDALSCVVLIVGAALICILGLDRAGGWEGLQATINRLDWTEHHLHLVLPADHPAFPWPAVLLGLGLVLGPSYWIGNQAIVQRTLGAGSQNQARASYVFCAVLKLVFPVLLVLPGLIGLALFYDRLGDPRQWSESVANQVLPLLVVTLFAVAQFTVALLVREAVSQAAAVGAREAGKYEDIEQVARVVDAVLDGAHDIDVATVTVPAGTPPLEDTVTAVANSGVRIVLEVGQPDAAGRNATPYDFGDMNVTCDPPVTPVLQSDEVRVTVCIDLGRRPVCSWLYSFSPDYIDFSTRCFRVSSLVKKE